MTLSERRENDRWRREVQVDYDWPRQRGQSEPSTRVGRDASEYERITGVDSLSEGIAARRMRLIRNYRMSRDSRVVGLTETRTRVASSRTRSLGVFIVSLRARVRAAGRPAVRHRRSSQRCGSDDASGEPANGAAYKRLRVSHAYFGRSVAVPAYGGGEHGA